MLVLTLSEVLGAEHIDPLEFLHSKAAVLGRFAIANIYLTKYSNAVVWPAYNTWGLMGDRRGINMS